MKLFAISDLHVGFRENMLALRAMRKRPNDWLIVAGDVAEEEGEVCDALGVLCSLYARVIWVPGNHELWTTNGRMLRGELKYRSLVDHCRKLGVLTPEDPYSIWDGEGGQHLIVPLFLLYDYSFAPNDMPPETARRWAAEAGVVCADEELLHPDPYPSREDWCKHRCLEAEARLHDAMDRAMPTVLVNHFPLKRELTHLPYIPRFRIWCGTRRTEDWAVRFRASVVVSGHLHIRGTRSLNGTRFEEVSLGYPGRQWDPTRGIDAYVRQILPKMTA
jgi:3',5'-cyclic AMP phosphodiesterase CpdA